MPNVVSSTLNLWVLVLLQVLKSVTVDWSYVAHRLVTGRV